MLLQHDMPFTHLVSIYFASKLTLVRTRAENLCALCVTWHCIPEVKYVSSAHPSNVLLYPRNAIVRFLAVRPYSTGGIHWVFCLFQH